MRGLRAMSFAITAVAMTAPLRAQAPAAELPLLEVGKTFAGEVRADSPVVHTPGLDAVASDDPEAVPEPTLGIAHRLDLPAGTTTIELRSWILDAYLVVRDAASGEVVAEDDDGLLRTHARVVLEVDAPASALVVACSLDGTTGAFELRAVAGEMPELEPLERVSAEIDDARKELAIRVKVLGLEHPDTATSLNNLALLLDSMDQHEEARTLYERALAIREQVLGSEHPDTAESLNNLALVLFSMRRYEEARRLYSRALAIQKQVHGPRHPATAESLNNFATLLYSIGLCALGRSMLFGGRPGPRPAAFGGRPGPRFTGAVFGAAAAVPPAATSVASTSASSTARSARRVVSFEISVSFAATRRCRSPSDRRDALFQPRFLRPKREAPRQDRWQPSSIGRRVWWRWFSSPGGTMAAGALQQPPRAPAKAARDRSAD